MSWNLIELIIYVMEFNRVNNIRHGIVNNICHGI